MSAATPARYGQINQSGAVDAVFLKTFGGEVLTAFERKNVMLARTAQKAGMGKSIAFPRFGKATAAYHTPGAEITGTAYSVGELVMTPDALLLSHHFEAEIDELLAHYDARSPITNEMGIKLATLLDEHIQIEGLLGARLTAVGNELPTGTPINGATTGALAFRSNDSLLLASEVASGTGHAASNAAKVQAWVDTLQAAAKRLDENDVDADGRFVIVRPQEYYPLIGAMQTNGFSAVHKDIGGSGSISEGTIHKLMGFEIVSSNNLPKTDISANSTTYNYHGGAAGGAADFDTTVGLIGCNGAVAVGNWKGIETEVTWDPRRLGYLLTARYLKGIKYYRPEALIELKIATSTVV